MIKLPVRKCILVSLILLFSVPLFGAEKGWYLEKEEDGIEVYVASIKGSAVKSFRGVITVKSPLKSVLSVIADASSYPKWLHNCKSARTIKRVGDNEIYNYIVTDMPWPVVDRDSVVRSIKVQDKTSNKVTIEFVARPELLEKQADTVRITDMKGSWKLIPQDNGELKIIYQVSVDPGGSIPKWLVNSMVVDIPFNTLQNLRRIAKEPKYK